MNLEVIGGREVHEAGDLAAAYLGCVQGKSTKDAERVKHGLRAPLRFWERMD